jgi:hypothetical protein
MVKSASSPHTMRTEFAGTFVDNDAFPYSFSGVLEVTNRHIGHLVFTMERQDLDEDYDEDEYYYDSSVFAPNYATCVVVTCPEIKTVYVLEALEIIQTEQAPPLPLLDILRHIVFPAYLVKHFSQDSFDDDWDVTADAYSKMIGRALGMPELVSEKICNDIYPEWMQPMQQQLLTDVMSHFGTEIHDKCIYRNDLSPDANDDEAVMAFLQDYFGSMTSLWTLQDYVFTPLAKTNGIRVDHGLCEWKTVSTVRLNCIEQI